MAIKHIIASFRPLDNYEESIKVNEIIMNLIQQNAMEFFYSLYSINIDMFFS